MLAVFFAAVLASAEPTAPAAPAAPAAAASPPAAPAKVMAESQKVTCKTEESTGSRLGAMRVCMTNAQWQERSMEDTKALQDNQQRAFTH
jgi:hypothetical protein